MNIPNILTTIRLCMMPVFLFVYFLPGQTAKWWAMGVILLAFFTDVLDGYIARHYHQITNLGKILDPVADKAMQITVLTCIVFNNISLLWVAAFILMKDILLGIGAIVMYKKGIVGQANWFGKTACFVNICACVMLLFPFSVPLPEAWVTFTAWLLIVVNALSLASYCIMFVKVQSQ